MKHCARAVVLHAACLSVAIAQFAQTGRKQIQIDPSKPGEVVATLDGAPVTAGEFQSLLVAMDAKAREAAKDDAEEVLRYAGWLRRMAAEAEKRGLASRNPAKQQLEVNRIQLLSNIAIQQHELDEIVTPFEQRGYYEANRDAYSGIQLKLIYLPFTSETEELQAKRRAEEIVKKIRSGAVFTEMVKQYSKHEESKAKDGDFGEIRKPDQIPQAVKDAAFALKDGDVSDPVRLPNGYYIFQRTGTTVDPYEKVRDAIFTEIKQKRNLEWVNKHREAVKVEIIKTSGDDPKRTVAKLEGKPMTAADMENYLGAMDEKLRAGLRKDPADLFRGIGFMQRMADIAVQAKLDQQSPNKERLEMTRMQTLANALVSENEKQIVISESELQQAYKENLTYVSSAKLKIVFIPAAQGDEASDQQAKQLAEEIAAKIKDGANFIEMVKQYSKDPVSRDKDGDYGPLRITDDIPQPAKQAIWTMKPGGVSAPVRLPNGYYIFKLIGFEEPGLDKVRDELAKRLRALKNRQWMNSMRAQVQVTIAERKPAPVQ